MNRAHHGLTVAVSVKEGSGSSLQRTLERLNSIGGGNGRIFERSVSTITVSGTILPREPALGLPETFVFATSYWGSKENHIGDLIKTNKIALRQIFQHCRVPAEFDLRNDDMLFDFLNRFNHFSAFTSRFTCISKPEVEAEERLRMEIVSYIQNAQSAKVFEGLSATQIRTLVVRHLKAHGSDFAWAFKPVMYSWRELLYLFRNKQSPQTVAGFGILVYWGVVFSVLKLLNPDWTITQCLGVSFSVVVISVASLAYVMYLIGSAKHPQQIDIDFDHWGNVAATQLYPVINEMTASSPLKPGELRRKFYRSALTVIDKLYKPQVPTVRTIRWLTVNENRRLLFFSNYANTTDFYVRDFLNGATPYAVNFMFTNGCDFPDAPFLFLKGIKENPEGYMNAVRKRQLVTALRYIHCPDLTLDLIQKNRKIRLGLIGNCSENKANQWLQLF